MASKKSPTARERKKPIRADESLDPASAVDRKLARLRAGMLVWDRGELADFVSSASSAALRIMGKSDEASLVAARDVLRALASAIDTNDSELLRELQKPALKALAERELQRAKEAEGKSEGYWPDHTQPHLRARGGKQRLRQELINVASLFTVNGRAGEDEIKFFAKHVSSLVLTGPFRDLDPDDVQKRLFKHFMKSGLDTSHEVNAFGIATVLYGSAKEASNMFDAAEAMREKRNQKARKS